MSTKANYPINEIGAGKVGFSKTRSIIETAFYGNNVIKVTSLKEAYKLASGTIVTDMPVYNPEVLGLDTDARVLLFNDGAITGRYATARRIAGEPGVNCPELDKVAMDAIYKSRWKTMYHAEVYVGLDPEFMVKAHLLIPEGEENIMYNWMLNFQYISTEYAKMYKAMEMNLIYTFSQIHNGRVQQVLQLILIVLEILRKRLFVILIQSKTVHVFLV